MAVIVIALLVALASAAIISVVAPSTGLVDEWQARVQDDYPGWTVTDAHVRTLGVPGWSTSFYSLTMQPPDRDFSLVMVYLKEHDKPAISQDKVLRQADRDPDRATALLDYVEQHWAHRGEKTIGLTSTESTAFVDCGHSSSSWNTDDDSVLSYSFSSGGVVLEYDAKSGVWTQEEPASETTPSASVAPVPSLTPPLAKLRALARAQKATEAWYTLVRLPTAFEIMGHEWKGSEALPPMAPTWIVVMRGDFGPVGSERYTWAASVLDAHGSHVVLSTTPIDTFGAKLTPLSF